VLEREILPARIADYEPAMLDALMAAGEVVWAGVESLGDRDGRIALYLTDHRARLRPPGASGPAPDGDSRAKSVIAHLRAHGASFFAAVHEGAGGGFPGETVTALWDLVWSGLVTNDSLHALRALVGASAARPSRRARSGSFRSRRLVPPTAEGRWTLLEAPRATRSTTEWSTAIAQQLLTRHGVVTREAAAHEAVAGGFSAVYQVLKAMEDAGRVRRGYFVSGLGGAQFALPAALDLLRGMRDAPSSPTTVLVSATDPASPYGSLLKWPANGWAVEIARSRGRDTALTGDSGRGPTRTAGALAVLVDGRAAGYLRRGERELLLLVPGDEPARSRASREVAAALARRSAAREEGRRGMLVAEIDGLAATTHPAAGLFIDAGFLATAMGLQLRARGSLVTDSDR
jgi:ATP-dependent Lhr-like helicase